MNAYVYQAAFLCEPCAEQLADVLPPTADRSDSDSFPQGPYPDGGGEADSPQHCDHCGLFLENPLTAHGRWYVTQTRENGVTAQWRAFYEV